MQALLEFIFHNCNDVQFFSQKKCDQMLEHKVSQIFEKFPKIVATAIFTLKVTFFKIAQKVTTTIVRKIVSKNFKNCQSGHTA